VTLAQHSRVVHDAACLSSPNSSMRFDVHGFAPGPWGRRASDSQPDHADGPADSMPEDDSVPGAAATPSTAGAARRDPPRG